MGSERKGWGGAVKIRDRGGRARRLRSLRRRRTVLSRMCSPSVSIQTGLWWIVPFALRQAKVAVTGLFSRAWAPAGRSASVASGSRRPMVNAPRSPAGTVELIFILDLQSSCAGCPRVYVGAGLVPSEGLAEPVEGDLMQPGHGAHVAVVGCSFTFRERDQCCVRVGHGLNGPARFFF